MIFYDRNFIISFFFKIHKTNIKMYINHFICQYTIILELSGFKITFYKSFIYHFYIYISQD